MASNNLPATLSARLGEAGQRLDEARTGFLSALRIAEKAIKSNPLAAVAAGLGLGAVLGWIIKRR